MPTQWCPSGQSPDGVCGPGEAPDSSGPAQMDMAPTPSPMPSCGTDLLLEDGRVTIGYLVEDGPVTIGYKKAWTSRANLI